MNKWFYTTFSIVFITLLCAFFLQKAQSKEFNPNLPIDKYIPYKCYITQNNTPKIITRIFYQSEHIFALATNLDDFKTQIILIDESVKFEPKENNTKFDKLLQKYTSYTSIANNGIIKSNDLNTHKEYLSIDLCPSKKTGFENEFFEKLLSKDTSKPTPIAISITGKWIEKHNKEFLWLLTQQNEKKLAITWINHTYNHWYDNKLPLEKNFLNMEKTDLDFEILELEKLLLKYNQIPSIFIRFPGLIADEKIMKQMREKYFLIPLGSNAWIGKNEAIKDGSIILVHGNLNEHDAIIKAMKEIDISSLDCILNTLDR